MVNTLNKSDGISPVVREDLLKQVRTVEKDYLAIKKAVEAVKRLERESRRGILAPHLYQKAVELVNEALGSGVPATSLEPLRNVIQEYLSKVYSQSDQR